MRIRPNLNAILGRENKDGKKEKKRKGEVVKLPQADVTLCTGHVFEEHSPALSVSTCQKGGE